MISPPTDSLYKFIAIFGLVIFVWGITFPLQKSEEFELQRAEILTAVEESNNIGKRIQAKIVSLAEKRKSIAGDDPERTDIDKQIKELRNQLIDSPLSINIDEKIEVLTVLKKSLVQFKILGWMSICFGLVLIIIGFLLWYYKLQKHIDIKLQNDSSSQHPPPV